MTLNLDLREWTQSRGFRYLENSLDPKLIIFGEKHFEDELINAQVDLIRFLQPEYVLHEFQDRSHDKDSLYRNMIIRSGGGSGIQDREINIFRSLSKDLGFKLVGVDLPLSQILSSHYDSIEDRNRHREVDGMARTMTEYTRKSRKPVIAIVGAYHSHPASPIHPYLESKEIPYCVIQQAEAERVLREPKISLGAGYVDDISVSN